MNKTANKKEDKMQYDKIYRQNHKEERNAYQRKWQNDNKGIVAKRKLELNLCITCNSIRMSGKSLCEKHFASRQEYNRKIYAEARQKVLQGYGGVCACCGEATPEFLAIDHVNDDGKQHRAKGNGRGYMLFLEIIRDNFPPRFQVLCWNCNAAKEFFGMCPHKGRINGFIYSK
jgi:hypothetical protein